MLVVHMLEVLMVLLFSHDFLNNFSYVSVMVSILVVELLLRGFFAHISMNVVFST